MHKEHMDNSRPVDTVDKAHSRYSPAVAHREARRGHNLDRMDTADSPDMRDKQLSEVDSPAPVGVAATWETMPAQAD